MDSNGTQISSVIVIAWFALLAFGFGYNYVVDRFQRRTQRFTAEFVVGGVILTVAVSGLFIGWENAVLVILMFIASGAPMLLGSWKRAADDDEEAKRIVQDSVKKGNNK